MISNIQEVKNSNVREVECPRGQMPMRSNDQRQHFLHSTDKRSNVSRSNIFGPSKSECIYWPEALKLRFLHLKCHNNRQLLSQYNFRGTFWRFWQFLRLNFRLAYIDQMFCKISNLLINDEWMVDSDFWK